MKSKGLYTLKAADIAIAVIVIAASIAPLFSFNRQKTTAALSANIYERNKLVKQLPLAQDAVYRLKNMAIEVKQGRIRIAESDCPRQICVHSGWISGPAQTIVCVPNKVLVEIQGGAGQYDAVSY
jgi:hypothetical protein